MTAKQALLIEFAVGAIAATIGCGPLKVEGHEVYSATAVPAKIETYPHVRYHGDDAYLVGHDWYYREGWYGWVVFRDEPQELRAYRVQQTPAPTAQ
jgi:hypothetical protein